MPCQVLNEGGCCSCEGVLPYTPQMLPAGIPHRGLMQYVPVQIMSPAVLMLPEQ
jgi:hypothetical protein